MKEKLSENIGFYEAGDYLVSAGIWRPMGGDFGDSHEIGIQHKQTGEFKLLQGDWTYQSVQEVANAIAHLLSIKTEHYDPQWCERHFK